MTLVYKSHLRRNFPATLRRRTVRKQLTVPSGQLSPLEPFLSLFRRYVTKTRLYNFDPLKPQFYIVKLGFTGVYFIFFLFCYKTLCVLVITASPRRFLRVLTNYVLSKNMKNCLFFFIWKGSVFGGEVFIQSTLVISNSKGLSEILRDTRTSTYQICITEEKLIWLTTFNKYICNWTLEVPDILKILWKRGEIAPEEQESNFSPFPQYFLHVVRFSSLGRDQIFTSR